MDRVADVEPFVLKIGEYSPELLNVYRRVGCASSTFITAYNPFSNVTAEAAAFMFQHTIPLILFTLQYHLLGKDN